MHQKFNSRCWGVGVSNDSMSIPAILPMKGVSERVAGKNMKPFDAKPFYHCVAATLEASAYISEIIVDTDSEEIAHDAGSNFSKVRVRMRPEHLRGQMVSMEEIVSGVLEELPSEHFVQAFATCPLMRVDTLESAINAYFENLGKYDSLFTVKRIQQRLHWASGALINDPHGATRTQELEPVYERNACLYIASKTSFSNAGGCRVGKSPYLFVMDDIESIDVDREADFFVAEAVYRALRSETGEAGRE